MCVLRLASVNSSIISSRSSIEGPFVGERIGTRLRHERRWHAIEATGSYGSPPLLAPAADRRTEWRPTAHLPATIVRHLTFGRPPLASPADRRTERRPTAHAPPRISGSSGIRPPLPLRTDRLAKPRPTAHPARQFMPILGARHHWHTRRSSNTTRAHRVPACLLTAAHGLSRSMRVPILRLNTSLGS